MRNDEADAFELGPARQSPTSRCGPGVINRDAEEGAVVRVPCVEDARPRVRGEEGLDGIPQGIECGELSEPAVLAAHQGRGESVLLVHSAGLAIATDG